jgi:hypothetical protein
MAEIDQSQLAAACKQLYHAPTRIYLCPMSGEVRLGELNVATHPRARPLPRRAPAGQARGCGQSWSVGMIHSSAMAVWRGRVIM